MREALMKRGAALANGYVGRVLYTLGVLAVIAALVWFVWISYFGRFAYGSTGDDSPGYIFLGARMAQMQPLLWNDALTTRALTTFGTYELVDWVMPTHHELIHPNGTIASKYPLGASMILAVGAVIAGTPLGMYVTNPLLAVLVVVFTIFLYKSVYNRESRARAGLAVVAGALVAITPLFVSHAVAQPMREIPSMACLLLATMAFFASLRTYARDGRFSLTASTYMVIAGVLFGFACSVRETSIMMLPAFVVAGVMGVSHRFSWTWHWCAETVRDAWKPVALFAVSAAIGLAPIAWNAVQISTHNEPFKKRDTGEVVILSNINHLQTISVRNAFVSEGRYRPDNGTLGHYANVIREFSPIPGLWVFMLLGIWFGVRSKNKEEQALTVFLSLWMLGTLTIFALWINPYSRYILPIVPPYMMLAVYGIYHASRAAGVLLRTPWLMPLALVCGFIAVAGTGYAQWKEQRRFVNAQIPEQRAMMQSDAATMERLATLVRTRAQTDAGISVQTEIDTTTAEAQPIVLFAGASRFGLSEVFWAQTGIRGLRLPIGDEVTTPEQLETFHAFIDGLQADGYPVFVWAEAGTGPEVQAFLVRQQAEHLRSDAYSFIIEASLYQLK